MLVQLTYDTTPAFFIATGRRGTQTIEVETEHLTPNERATLLECKEYPHHTFSLPQALELHEYSDTASAVATNTRYDATMSAVEWIAKAKRILTDRATITAEAASIQARIDARRKPEVQAQVDAVIVYIHELVTRRSDSSMWPNGHQTFSENDAKKLGIDLTIFHAAEATYTAMAKELRAESDAQTEAAKAAKLAEKLAWCAAHGSDQLRRGVEAGYNCQRLYVIERAKLEAPGFTVDFQNGAEWSARACPSLKALDMAAAADLLKLGESEVVWLTAPAVNSAPIDTDSIEDDTEGDDFDPCEAIVLREYLGKYDLVKVV